MTLSRRAVLAGTAVLATPSIVRAQARTFRIGAPLPTTGGLAPEGAKQQRGYDLWLNAVNANGGLMIGGARTKVEIVYADY